MSGRTTPGRQRVAPDEFIPPIVRQSGHTLCAAARVALPYHYSLFSFVARRTFAAGLQGFSFPTWLATLLCGRTSSALVPRSADGAILPARNRWTARCSPFSGPAITAVLTSDGSSEIVRIYNAAERNGVDLDPTFIGRDFACKHEKPFNQASMGLPSHYGKARCRTVPG